MKLILCIVLLLMNFEFYLISAQTAAKSCSAKKFVRCNVRKYYSVDGSCNNARFSWWGKSDTPFERFLPPRYDDDVGSPRTKSATNDFLPNARSIALTVHYPLPTGDDFAPKMSHYGTIFGQFLSFDISRVPTSSVKCSCNSTDQNCFNIETPSDDTLNSDQKCMTFVRSAASFPKFNCPTKEREQLNAATHWLDLSQVYGSAKKTNNQLREDDGTLKSSRISGLRSDFLQFGEIGTCKTDTDENRCFISGDPRVNENMILTSIFTIWAREHNRIVLKLKDINPMWSNEKLYQETRRILIAIYQKIVFTEYLPVILGNEHMRKHKLLTTRRGYFMGYDSRLSPILRNEFSAAALRFGHSLVNNLSLKSDASLNVIAKISFFDLLFNPRSAYEKGGLDSLCRGAFIDKSSAFDPHFTDAVQNHMFQDLSPNVETHRQSLSALNINRGRDHGIQPYVAYRKLCNLEVPESFENLKDIMTNTTISDLQKVYKSVQDIDLYTGLVSEIPIEDAVVGPTTACLLGRQFFRLKHGDRLYFENGHSRRTRFTIRQLREIKKSTISRILCDNLQLRKIQKNPFILPNDENNEFVPCRRFPKVNLEAWGESSNDEEI